MSSIFARGGISDRLAKSRPLLGGVRSQSTRDRFAIIWSLLPVASQLPRRTAARERQPRAPGAEITCAAGTPTRSSRAAALARNARLSSE